MLPPEEVLEERLSHELRLVGLVTNVAETPHD